MSANNDYSSDEKDTSNLCKKELQQNDPVDVEVEKNKKKKESKKRSKQAKQDGSQRNENGNVKEEQDPADVEVEIEYVGETPELDESNPNYKYFAAVFDNFKITTDGTNTDFHHPVSRGEKKEDLGEVGQAERILQEESKEEDLDEPEPEAPADGFATPAPAEGLVTPSGMTTGVTGLETPDTIELRKGKRTEESHIHGTDTPQAAYHVIPEKRNDRIGGQITAEKLKRQTWEYLEEDNTCDACQECFECAKLSLRQLVQRIENKTMTNIVPAGLKDVWNDQIYFELTTLIEEVYPECAETIRNGWNQAVVFHHMGYCLDSLSVTYVLSRLSKVLGLVNCVEALPATKDSANILKEKLLSLNFEGVATTEQKTQTVESDTCDMRIPEIDLEVRLDALSGRSSTIEGLLTATKEQLDAQSSFFMGDSAESEDKKEVANFLTRPDDHIGLQVPARIVLDDSTGFSYGHSLTAPLDDSRLKKELYTRSYEQDDELGLNDMKVENYGELDIVEEQEETEENEQKKKNNF